MPKITLVEPQKKNPHRFNIYLDGIFAFGVDEDLIVDHRLITGKLLETSDVEKLLFEAEVGKLMERMYRLFNIRSRSEAEVRRYLKNLSFKRKMSKARASALKGQEEISEAAIELLITKLKQKQLLNDEQFARAWVEVRRKTRKKGKIVLKSELSQKGIGRDLIEQTLENIDEESEEILATQALEKKINIWKKLPPWEYQKKAYEFLMRRGFEYDVVKDVVEKMIKKY